MNNICNLMLAVNESSAFGSSGDAANGAGAEISHYALRFVTPAVFVQRVVAGGGRMLPCARRRAPRRRGSEVVDEVTAGADEVIRSAAGRVVAHVAGAGDGEVDVGVVYRGIPGDQVAGAPAVD